MSVITRMRKQVGVYWQFKAYDLAGNPTLYPPVPFQCRWVDEQTNYSDKNGEQRISKATVYVDRDMPLDSFIFLGAMANAPQYPKDVVGAVQIRSFSKTPNFKNTEYLRVAKVS